MNKFADSLVKETYTRVAEQAREQEPKNLRNYCQALCALLIWNPDSVDFLPPGSNQHRRQRLRYRARGIVEYDRALNQ